MGRRTASAPLAYTVRDSRRPHPTPTLLQLGCTCYDEAYALRPRVRYVSIFYIFVASQKVPRPALHNH